MLFPYQKRIGGPDRFEGIPSLGEWQDLTRVKTLFWTHARNNRLLHGIDHALELYDKSKGYFHSVEVERISLSRLSARASGRHGTSVPADKYDVIERDALQASLLGAVYDACNAWIGSKEQVAKSNRRHVVQRLAANSRTAYSMVIENMYGVLPHVDYDHNLSKSFSDAQERIDRSNNDLAVSCLGNLRSIVNRIAGDFGKERPALTEMSRRLHSEILARLTPDFQELYRDARSAEDLDMLPARIKGKYDASKILFDDLSSLFDKQSLLLPKLSDHSAIDYSELHAALRGILLPLSVFNRKKLDHFRLGGSDTLKGLSGGGETKTGALKARRNWKQADDFVAARAKETTAITINDLKEINRILNDGMPNNGGRPGEFRVVDETAGGGSAYPGPEFVSFLTEDFVRWVNDKLTQVKTLELAAVAYQRFVSIHPFSDGNGRTGRLFADLILERGGLLPAAYDGGEVMVAIFAQPQKGTEIVTTEAVIQRVFRAVMRSSELLSR